MSKLLPCPIEACGSTDIRTREYLGDHYVYCRSCYVRAAGDETKRDAIMFWNKLPRAEPPKTLDWPDSEGMWWMSRPGGVVGRVRAKANGGTFDAIYDSGSLLPRCHARTHRYRFIAAEPPTFPPAEPEYPPKPPRVLAHPKGCAKDPHWYQMHDEEVVRYVARTCEVIDHPDNDPEALRMIEEARDEDPPALIVPKNKEER